MAIKTKILVQDNKLSNEKVASARIVDLPVTHASLPKRGGRNREGRVVSFF